MDVTKVIADRYDDIDARREAAQPTHLSENDRIIWYVVATRCGMDMQGFASVFNQLLTEVELLFLIASLDRLEEPSLADAFRRAHAALRRVGFYDTREARRRDFGPELKAELSAVEEFLESKEAMWGLDTKLAALAP